MTRITIAKGDGIGPEIMDATLKILHAANAQLEFDEIEVGEKLYLSGNSSGISNESWEVIRRNKIFLKAPITTPQGGGYKSLNVSTRKFLGLFANVRPCKSYSPFADTKHPNMDVVIIRENEEDLYAGIEHQQTPDVVQCLKLISRSGCVRIVRYAFEYARHNGRKKVTCFTKDNIMKQTDGLFHSVFSEIASEYADIINEHYIVDIGAAKLADTPEMFDVIVMPNLYGDILSDVAAQIAGSVGLAGSSNIGRSCAMFEAIHGSAPSRAGQNKANPSGLIQASILMLHHIGQGDVAVRIQNAWLRTLEMGIHTYDVFKEGISTKLVGTREFAEEVITNLDQVPLVLSKAQIGSKAQMVLDEKTEPIIVERALIGIDVFLHSRSSSPDDLAEAISKCNTENLSLSIISNRGIKVWPNGFSETYLTDHWRCRFKTDIGQLKYDDLLLLLFLVHKNGFEVIKTENLYLFDGVPAFSAAQGQ